ncbi:MAG TPA: glycosyltransferase family 2 protein [Steroidobacteraceae bacterium]|nr:glycosyltransferase family 2 protein [Steroidobacteraceae bacterium]
MTIHSICLVKNEGDIIERTLAEAARWSDYIYVYDNGSTDHTWDKVRALAEHEPCIVPFRSERVPFNDNLRRLPFAHYRYRCQIGDWWCRLDADEMYIDSPRDFLARVPPDYDTVWSASFQFYFTDEDLARYERDPALYADDVPIELKCRYYRNNWSEIRFFRYHPRLQWHTGGFPYPLLKSYPRRIRLKHYPYRSPQQIERRLATRWDAVRRGMFRHETVESFAAASVALPDRRDYRSRRMPESWMSRVAPASSLKRDDGREYVIDERAMPRIVAEPDSPRHRLRKAWRRTVARLASEWADLQGMR